MGPYSIWKETTKEQEQESMRTRSSSLWRRYRWFCGDDFITSLDRFLLSKDWCFNG